MKGDPWSDGSTGYTYRSAKWHYQWVPESNQSKLFDIQNDPFSEKEISFYKQSLILDFQNQITKWNEDIIQVDINTNESD